MKVSRSVEASRTRVRATSFTRSRGAQTRALVYSGFTLIEILVVMLLLVIVIGMVGLSVSGDEHRAVREESERLSVLLHAVQQEAILQGKVYALELGLDGYEFLILGQDGKFQSLAQADDMLRPRTLPPLPCVQVK